LVGAPFSRSVGWLVGVPISVGQCVFRVHSHVRSNFLIDIGSLVVKYEKNVRCHFFQIWARPTYDVIGLRAKKKIVRLTPKKICTIEKSTEIRITNV